MDIQYTNVTAPFIRDCFEETLTGFAPLCERSLTLRRTRLRHHTMRAQPVVDFGFFDKDQRRYRVDISNHAHIREYVRIAELPREVLIGWLAHELGHVMDYLHRSGTNLIDFGLRYLWSDPFRSEAERRADLYAIQYGFSDYLRATKQYILQHAHLPKAYKAAIRKYYMSPAELEQVVHAVEEHGADAFSTSLPFNIRTREMPE